MFQLCKLFHHCILHGRMAAVSWSHICHFRRHFNHFIQVHQRTFEFWFILYERIFPFRSLITKNVNPDEVGKVFSIVGTFQALLPFASSPAFGFLYRETVAYFPAAFLLLVAALKGLEGIVVIVVYIGVKLDAKKASSIEEQKKDEHEMHLLLQNDKEKQARVDNVSPSAPSN